MTNNDELALRLKAAAHKAKQANDLYIEGKITLSECTNEVKDYLEYSDNPANILALLAERDDDKKQLAAMSQAFLNLKLLADVYLHAYEEAKASVAELQRLREEETMRANRQRHNGFMMATKHMKQHENVHYADAAEVEIAALHERISKLEARTVRVASIHSNWDWGERYLLASDVEQACAAAGIKLEVGE